MRWARRGLGLETVSAFGAQSRRASDPTRAAIVRARGSKRQAVLETPKPANRAPTVFETDSETAGKKPRAWMPPPQHAFLTEVLRL